MIKIVISLLCLSIPATTFSMQRLLAYFSFSQPQEKENLKAELGINPDSPHDPFVGRDAVKKEIYLNHLKTYLEEIYKRKLHKTETSSGTVIQTPTYMLTLIAREQQKYTFFARNLPSPETTVCDKTNYEIHKDKAEIIADANSLQKDLDPKILHAFTLFLDRIAVNKTTENIQTDSSMTTDQKVKALEDALDKLKQHKKSHGH